MRKNTRKLPFRKCVPLFAIVPLLLLSGCKPSNYQQTESPVSVRLLSEVKVSGEAEGFVYLYDENGNLLEYRTLSGDTVEQAEKYTYDDQGNRLTASSYTSGDRPDSRWEYTYDKNGNQLSCRCFTAAGVMEHNNTYTYDDAGRILSESSLDADGTLRSKTVYSYDSAGHTLTVENFDSNEVCQSRTQWSYDEKGNPLTQEYYEAGSLCYRYRKTFDQSGNLLTFIHESDGKIIDSNEYTYDAEGNMLSRRYLDSGELRYQYAYTYGSAGELLEESVENSDGSFFSRTVYTYDASGRQLSKEFTGTSRQYRLEWTYDESGNLLSYTELDSAGEPVCRIELSYTDLTLPPETAARCREQQEKLLSELLPE